MWNTLFGRGESKRGDDDDYEDDFGGGGFGGFGGGMETGFEEDYFHGFASAMTTDDLLEKSVVHKDFFNDFDDDVDEENLD